MSSINNSSTAYQASQYLNANQRMAAGALGMDVNKLNDTVSAASQKYAAMKTQSSSASGSINATISSESQNINKVYEQVKKSGNQQAIDGFRGAVVNFVKNQDAAGLKSFIDTGVRMSNPKDSSAYTDMLAVSNSISKQTSTKSADQFIKEAAATYAKSGTDSMKSYSEAANSVISKSETKSLTDMNEKSSALNNLANTFSAVQGQNVSEAKIQSQLADISANVQKQGDLKSVNQYLNSQFQNTTSGGILSTAGKSSV